MGRALCILALCLLTGCASQLPYAPALPEPSSGTPNLVPLVPVEAPPPPEPAVQQQLVPPMALPSPETWHQMVDVQAPAPKVAPPEPPAKTITRANALATMTPSKEGFAQDASVIQRYPYRPGVRYEVPVSPHAATAILLPPGERLAAAPMLNPEAWDVAKVEAGEGAAAQEAVLIRPLTVGLDTTIVLLTKAGLQLFCRLRSVEKTALVAVTWDVPTIRPQPSPEPAAMPPNRPQFAPPHIDASRLHTSYTITWAGKGPLPWGVESVLDDGKITVVKFKEPLRFTAAPIVLGRHTDGSPALVQYNSFAVPGRPELGEYYLVRGLWPALVLRGGDGLEIAIVRQP